MASEKCDHGKLSLRTDRDVEDHEEELQLRHLHSDAPLDQGTCRAHNGHDNFVQELYLWNTMKHLCGPTTGMSTLCRGTATVKSRWSAEQSEPWG